MRARGGYLIYNCNPNDYSHYTAYVDDPASHHHTGHFQFQLRLALNPQFYLT